MSPLLFAVPNTDGSGPSAYWQAFFVTSFSLFEVTSSSLSSTQRSRCLISSWTLSQPDQLTWRCSWWLFIRLVRYLSPSLTSLLYASSDFVFWPIQRHHHHFLTTGGQVSRSLNLQATLAPGQANLALDPLFPVRVSEPGAYSSFSIQGKWIRRLIPFHFRASETGAWSSVVFTKGKRIWRLIPFRNPGQVISTWYPYYTGHKASCEPYGHISWRLND